MAKQKSDNNKVKNTNVTSSNMGLGIENNTQSFSKIIAVAVSVVAIAGFFGYNFYFLPNNLLSQTDTEVQKRETEKAKKNSENAIKDYENRASTENPILNFEKNKDWTLAMNIKDFGTLNINLKNDYAPKSVENFVRLAYRGYFNDSIFHRMVKQESFGVIQGGQKEVKDNKGVINQESKSAFYVDENTQGNIPDELWIVKPIFESTETQNKLTNTPVFRSPELYKNFSSDTGTVEYAKGLILMAKTSAPDSASSQFFVTFDKTILPAQYTVFGVIEPSSFNVLDKINKEVNPVVVGGQATQAQSNDGKPNKELRISEVKITKPQI